jgi:hypothetical protein
MVVIGEYNVLNADTKDVETWPLVLLFTEKAAGIVRYTNPLRKDEPTVAEFVGTSGFGSKSSNPVDGSWILQPRDFLLLAGQSPNGMLGMNWTFVESENGNIVAHGKNYDAEMRIINTNLTNRWDIEIEFEAETLCPIRLKTLQEGREEMEYELTGKVRVGTEWLPQAISMYHLLGSQDRPMAETRHTWTFAGAEEIDTVQFPIPEGLQVGDFRLDVTDYHRSLFPPKGVKPIMYTWDSRLPSLDELKGIQSGIPPSQDSFPTWLLPVVLITIGSTWLWISLSRARTRRNS